MSSTGTYLELKLENLDFLFFPEFSGENEIHNVKLKEHAINCTV
jgi:hypothetical protein